MRLYDLVKKMTPSEQRGFEVVINSHKRKRLAELYKILLRRDAEAGPPEKKHLFLALYGKGWTKKDDYLLRNEIRLLNDAVEDFLLMRAFEAELKARAPRRNQMMLSIFREKGLARHFESRFKKAFANAKKEQRWGDAAELVDHYRDHVLGEKEASADGFADLFVLQQEQLRLMQKHAIEEIRLLEARMSGAMRIVRIVRKDAEYPDLMAAIDLHDPELTSPYAQYLHFNSQAYRYAGEERIDLLHKCLAPIEKLVRDRKIPATVFVYGSIALEYFLMGQYAAADEWYAKLVAFTEAEKVPLRMDMVFNYFSNLIKLEKYAEAIRVFERYREITEENMRVHYRFRCLVAMCHIFLGQPAEARRRIPPDIQQRPEPQYNYFRFIYLLVFYLRGDHEDTLREARNFSQALAKREVHQVDVRRIVQLFRELVQALQAVPDQRRARLQKLDAKVADYATNLPPMLSDFLPFLWLRKEIKAHL